MWLINIFLIYFFIRSICVFITRSKILNIENKFCKKYNIKQNFLFYDSLPGYFLMLFNITLNLTFYIPTEKDLLDIYYEETVS